MENIIFIDNGSYALRLCGLGPSNSSACQDSSTGPFFVEILNALGGKLNRGNQPHTLFTSRTIPYSNMMLCNPSDRHVDMNLAAASTQNVYLIRPMDGGFLSNVPLQWQIHNTLQALMLERDVVLSSKRVLLLVPPVVPEPLREAYETLVFAHSARFLAVRLITIAHVTARVHSKDVCCVLDIGHAYTWIIPCLQRRPILDAARRLDIGGAALTGYLRELVSHRSPVDLRRDPIRTACLKHHALYVTLDFEEALLRARQNPTTGRILYAFVPFPHILEPDSGSSPVQASTVTTQRVSLQNERFTVPEILFTPSLLGVQQMGLVDVMIDVLNQFPEEFREAFMDNVVVIGGTAQIEGLKERLEKELAQRLAHGTCVRIHLTSTREVLERAVCSLSPDAFDPFIDVEEYWGDPARFSKALWSMVSNH